MTAANGTTNPFTDQQYSLLLQMVADGKSWTEIGESCGHAADSCSTTYHRRKKQPPRKDGHQLWCAEDKARLKHMRGVLHMSFQDIGRELGRTAASCNTKYLVMRDEPDPRHGYPELGMRVSVTPAALADRDARYQAWLQQPAAAALMGDPLPGRSALDMRGK